MAKTVEQKVADTILQRPDIIRIGEREIVVAKPTTASLIMASAAASKMPRVNINGSDIISEMLRVGKDCNVIGEVLACLIVEAKGSTGSAEERLNYENKIKETSSILLEECSPSKLEEIALQLLQTSEVSHFFGLSTFLIDVNLTKATREVETTASGQQ